MDVKMEDVIQEKSCVFEELLEIDFDYEFDVAKFFDFTKIETSEEIMESELWFEYFQGHLPSPMLVKLDKGADDLADGLTYSPRNGPCDAYSMDNYSGKSQNSLNSEGKKGSMMLKSKLKPTSQSKFPVNSRLLQPTASRLAKQDQYTVARSTRVSRRHQRHGNPLKSPGETDATKRQKLEIGYLRKVAQLKHLTSFLHKPSKKVGTTDVNSHAKPKNTVPKEPNFATANRARQRSKSAPELGNDAKYSGSSFRAKPLNGKIQETQSSAQTKIKIKPPLPKFQSENARSGRIANGSRVPESKSHFRTNFNKALLQENSDQVYNFRARLVNKKISSTKRDIGVLRNYKESTVSREFKLCSNRKLSQNPPSEMFSKLSLNPKTHPISLPGQDLLEVKVSKKVSFANMKENKNANVVTGKPMRCFGNAGRMLTDIGNQITIARTFKIY